MRVELKLFASLASYASHHLIGADGHVDLISPVSVGHLVDMVSIPRQAIKLIFINGVHADMETIVSDGDRLGLFPPIGGG